MVDAASRFSVVTVEPEPDYVEFNRRRLREAARALEQAQKMLLDAENMGRVIERLLSVSNTVVDVVAALREERRHDWEGP